MRRQPPPDGIGISGATAVVAVERAFSVTVAPLEAWEKLVQVGRWPQWAPHISRVEVSPGPELGQDSTGTLWIRGLGRTSFRMSAWEPPQRWEWVGRAPGLRIRYDHRFAPAPGGASILTWTVVLEGPLAKPVRPLFARVYGRKVDAAILGLTRWIAHA